MKLRFFLLLITPLFLFQCSPKPTEPIVETPVVEKVIKPDPNTPCMTLNQLKGYKREEVENAYVLYRDQIKLGTKEAAYPLWQKAFYGAPGANGKVKYHYNDGIEIFKHFFTQETDENIKKSYVDSVRMVYDKRAECFGEEEYIAGRKAFDFYYTFNEYVDEEEIWSLFLENVDSKGEKTDYFVVNPFTKMLFDRILQKKISYEEGRKYADIVFNAVDYGVNNCEGKNCEAWEIIEAYAPVRLEALEGLDSFYLCDYYDSKYYPIYQADPDNCESIELAYRRLLRGQCAQDNPHLIELKSAKATKCYTPPPPPGPLKQAFNAYNEGDYRNAIRLFEEFVEKTEDVNKKAKYTLLIAKIYYGDLKDYPSSRKYALKSATYRENWGEPYMLIGKLYASSGPLCGPGRGWDSQIVTWPAIDKWQYAKKIDPEAAAEANDLIRQYWQYMPNKEDIFQRRKQPNDSFRVGCWIQENTTIRTSD